MLVFEFLLLGKLLNGRETDLINGYFSRELILVFHVINYKFWVFLGFEQNILASVGVIICGSYSWE